MYKKKVTAITALIFAAIVAGCGSDAPNCSDSATLTLVRKLVATNTGGNHKATEAELAQVLKIDSPRSTGYNDKIKKYTCEATVIVDDQVKMPIRYESQKEDKGEHTVALQKFSFADQGALSLALFNGLGKLRPSAEPVKPSTPAPSTSAADEWANQCVIGKAAVVRTYSDANGVEQIGTLPDKAFSVGKTNGGQLVGLVTVPDYDKPDPSAAAGKFVGWVKKSELQQQDLRNCN